MESSNYVMTGGGDSRALAKRRERTRWFFAGPFVFIASGVALLSWASLSVGFRNSNGELSGRFALPLSAGVALILSGLFAGTKWKASVLWFALFLIGQAASLQMIDAGRLIHFQHYRLLPELYANDPLLLVVLGLQTVIVLVGISKHFSAIWQWLRKRYSIWRLILIAAFLFFAGAVVTPAISEYVTSLFLAAVVRLVNLANIILLVWSIPGEFVSNAGQKLKILLGGNVESEDKKPFFDRFVVLAALWVVLLSGSLSYFVYQNHPHVPDETQYLFQARYMAAGQLTVKAPAVPEAFSMYMVPYQEDRWFGVFSPAWPAMLGVGLKLGAAWSINPILAGLCVFLAYAFFREFYSITFARISVLLLCCSPWFIFMDMSFMSHTLTLVCALGAILLLRKALASEKPTYALCSGLLIGVLSLVRPYDAVLVAALLGIWALISTKTLGKRFLKPAIALGIGTIAIGALVFPYNKAVTGQAAVSPPDAYYAKYFWPNANSIGFGSDRGIHWGLDAFPGHSPLEAAVNAAVNTCLLDTELFGWGIGSLALATLFLFSGKASRRAIWPLAAIATIIGGYSLFWYHGGPDFGARYWFLCIIPLIALTVSGIEWLSREINETADHPVKTNLRVVLAVVILSLGSLVCYMPWRALDKYYHYLGMQPGIVQLARENNFGRSLVLIRGDEHPDYQSAWIYNPVNFEGDAPIYAFNKSEQVEMELLRAYSDRPVWIVDGPTRANGNYRVVKGPLSANELLAEEKQ